MGIKDVMHQIFSLNLNNSSFKLQTVLLENSRQCEITSDGIEVKNSRLDIYAERIIYGHELLSYNLIEVGAKYDAVNTILTPNLYPSIIQKISNFSSNPMTTNFISSVNTSYKI